MSFFKVPHRWCIPEAAILASMREMAIDGAQGREGVAMWLGNYEDETAIITHVVALRGPGVKKAPDQLIISAALTNDVTDLTIEHQVTLIGQIHSHGKNYGIDLSLADRTYGIAVPGFLSVVAPDYAMRAQTSIKDCGVHVFEPGIGWRRFSQTELAERVSITSYGDVPILVAGCEKGN